MMSMTTDRRSFLFGASVAGFGILAPGPPGLGGGRRAERDAEYRLHRRGRQGAAATRTRRPITAGSSRSATSTRSGWTPRAEKHKEAKKYNDFRELLHELGPRLDAVVVSTPDHTHAVAAVTAMRMGKHVYCQKPLAHSV